MSKFNPGDTCYHKASLKKGVIASKMVISAKWYVAWEDHTKTTHTEDELFTEKEYKEKYPEHGNDK